MNHPFGGDFRWETLSEAEKEELRAVMHARLTEPDLSIRAIEYDWESEGELPEDYHRIRLFMAMHPGTPPPVLHQLARTDNHLVLERVAENPRTHVSTLSYLSDNNHPDVRAAVAENVNVSMEIMRKLASDEHPDVRYRIAENHHTAMELLELLSDDPNPYVACRAQQTLKRLLADNLAAGTSNSASKIIRYG